jgi:hypothetical protein
MDDEDFENSVRFVLGLPTTHEVEKKNDLWRRRLGLADDLEGDNKKEVLEFFEFVVPSIERSFSIVSKVAAEGNLHINKVRNISFTQDRLLEISFEILCPSHTELNLPALSFSLMKDGVVRIGTPDIKNSNFIDIKYEAKFITIKQFDKREAQEAFGKFITLVYGIIKPNRVDHMMH